MSFAVPFFTGKFRNATTLAVGLLTVACAAVQSPVTTAELETGAQASSASARATWLHHPLKKLPATATLEIKPGVTLEVDASGNRCLTGGKDPEASAFGAPEPLSGLIKTETDYIAVGQSGTLYFFSQPLGPFVSTHTQAVPFVKTRVMGNVLMSISSEGELFRSVDQGRHFKRVNAPGFFVDIAASEANSVFAVAVPETWYQSFDRGGHFELAKLPPIAPLDMSTGPSGRLVVHGLFSSFSPMEGRWEDAPEPSRPRPTKKLNQFARVSAIVAQTALLDEDGYFSLSSTKDEDTFRVERGKMDEKLTSYVIARPSACATFRVVGRTRTPLLICKDDAPIVAPLIRMLRWDEKTREWDPLKLTLRGPFDGLKVVQSSRGEVVLAGACAPHTSELGCSPHGVVWIKDDKKPGFFQLPIDGELLELKFDSSDDLWALVQRKKDNHLFLIGPIVEPSSSSGKIPVFVDITRVAPEVTVDAKQRASLLLSDAGLVSIVVERFGAPYLVQLSRAGQVLSVHQAPMGTSLVHGTGRRLSAVDVKRQLYWGSESGGLHWAKQPLPSALCSEQPCEPQLRCTSRGCLVGDELVRVGYLGPAQGLASAPLRLGADKQQPQLLDRLVCRVSEADAQAPVRLSGVPTAHDALLGKSLWSGLVLNAEQATATVIHVPLGHTKIVERTLFARGPSSQNYALQIFAQIEGNAALRYPVFPGTQDLAGPIELAWDNRILDATEHATIGIGVQGPGAQLRLDERLQPSLMSVAGPGLFFQADQDKTQELYYFPGNGAAAEKVERPTWPALGGGSQDNSLLEELARGARTEHMVVDGERSALLLLANNRVVVRKSEGQAGDAQAYLMGNLDRSQTDLTHAVHLSYRGAQLGFTSIQNDVEGDQKHAQFVEPGKGQTFLPPVSVALQHHLPNRPRVCDEIDMSTTARMIASRPKNQTRQIEVLGINQNALLLTAQDAIVFGSPEKPCLGIWEATAHDDAEEGHFSALVVPGKQGGSWLFHNEPQDTSNVRVSARPMSCSFE